MKLAWRLLIQLMLILALIAGGATWWLHLELSSAYYAAKAKETFVEIPRGASLGVIAGILADAGILHSRSAFMLYTRWIGGASHLKAGEYQFTFPATPVQVARKIMHGEVYSITVTIPEGLTGHETIELLTAAGLGKPEKLEAAMSRVEWIRDLSPTALNLEGYLFPDTYRFPRHISSEDIVWALVDQFRLRLASLVSNNPMPPSWTSSRIVILASMIEKEAKAASERPLVASVLVNRLRVGMPLACDPTIIYARKLDGTYDGSLHKADLQVDSPYNTYIKRGLPPGPIANPGAASLKAALTPAQSDFFYYVSRNDGTHQFSRDYREHQANVFRFQKQIPRKRAQARSERIRGLR